MRTIGWHRQVSIYDDYVLKTARNKVSVHCNRTEAELSGSSPYLAKVLEVADDFTWIKMERVELPGLRDRLWGSRFLKQELPGISDVRWYNVGMKDGRPVLYDYGGTLVSWKLLYRRLRK